MGRLLKETTTCLDGQTARLPTFVHTELAKIIGTDRPGKRPTSADLLELITYARLPGQKGRGAIAFADLLIDGHR
jgi:hypothetical protein